MDTNTKIRKLELEKEIAKAERERDRSLKWFFINLLVLMFALVVAGLILWLVPKVIANMAQKFKMFNTKTDPKEIWTQQVRLDYIKWGMFVFVFAWVTTWIFWALFRFRKWSGYHHEVEVLKEELKKLEKER